MQHVLVLLLVRVKSTNIYPTKEKDQISQATYFFPTSSNSIKIPSSLCSLFSSLLTSTLIITQTQSLLPFNPHSFPNEKHFSVLSSMYNVSEQPEKIQIEDYNECDISIRDAYKYICDWPCLKSIESKIRFGKRNNGATR